MGIKNLLRRGKLVEGGTEIVVPCPRCGHEKFHCNPDKKAAWCFFCHHKIRAGSREFDKLDLTFRPKKQPGILAQIPDLYEPSLYPEAEEFLEQKGVPVDHPDIRYAPSQQMLYVRITSPLAGYHPSWHRRSIRDGGWVVLPGTNKASYWYEPVLWPGPRVILVEGVWDAMCIGHGAVSLLGTQMSQAHVTGILRRGWTNVAIFLDADLAGRKAEGEIEHILRGAGCRTRIIRHECRRPAAPPFEPRYVEPSECGCRFLEQAHQWVSREMM